MINMVISMTKNEFDDEVKYRLFRSVQEILHPTISKKNISDYKIILEEDILPVRIFYPKKISNVSKIMIYIHGNGTVTDCLQKYSDICKDLSKKANCLVIAVEYLEEENHYKQMYQDVYETVSYLYERLEKDGIDLDHIVLVGDSTGCNIIAGIHALSEGKINIRREILFYPVFSTDYVDKNKYESFSMNESFNIRLLENLNEYFTFIAGDEKNDKLLNPISYPVKKIPSTLLFVGKVDSLRDEIKEYELLYPEDVCCVELPFAGHGFLQKMDEELEKEIFDKILEFVEN